MPLLREEAEALSNNALLAGIIETLIDKEELFALLPFARLDNKALVYNREDSLPGIDLLDPNDTISESAATFTEHTAKLRIMAGDVDVDKFLKETMGDTNDQLAVQLAAKTKALVRQFKFLLATGDSSVNSKAFDGVKKMAQDAGGAQNGSAGTNGAALTLSMLDDLVDMVPNGVDVIMMRPGTLRAYRALLRAAGGNDGSMLQLENFGRPIIAHNGIPIIVNDFLPKNEVQGSNSNTCSIYGLRLNEADGLHGLYGGDTAGIRIENVGTVQNKDSERWRVKWYAGTCLKSSRSIARMAGVTNV